MEHKPSEAFELGKKGGAFKAHLHSFHEGGAKTPSQLVFFDDGMYSGKQMSTFVSEVVKAAKEASEPGTLLTVYVICPYMTDFGKEKLELVAKENSDVRFEIMGTHKISTIAEVMDSDEDIKALTHILWKEELSEESGDFKDAYKKGPYSRGNIWFDHKVPNFLSFIQAIEDGAVYDTEGNLTNGHYERNSQNEPVFIPNEGAIHYRPIPVTQPPYKGD